MASHLRGIASNPKGEEENLKSAAAQRKGEDSSSFSMLTIQVRSAKSLREVRLATAGGDVPIFLNLDRRGPKKSGAFMQQIVSGDPLKPLYK